MKHKTTLLILLCTFWGNLLFAEFGATIYYAEFTFVDKSKSQLYFKMSSEGGEIYRGKGFSKILKDIPRVSGDWICTFRSINRRHEVVDTADIVILDVKKITKVVFLKLYQSGMLDEMTSYPKTAIDTLLNMKPYHDIYVDLHEGESGTSSFLVKSYAPDVNVKEIYRLIAMYYNDLKIMSSTHPTTLPLLPYIEKSERKSFRRKIRAIEKLRARGIFIFTGLNPC